MKDGVQILQDEDGNVRGYVFEPDPTHVAVVSEWIKANARPNCLELNGETHLEKEKK